MIPAAARTRPPARAVLAGLLLLAMPLPSPAQTTATVSIRGHPQTLRLYGPPTGRPVVLSSGDGGWVHLAPPLAAIHATHDEFVPLEEVRRVLDHARGPTRLYVVAASNHRFSDNQGELRGRLADALAWLVQQAPGAEARP